MIFISLIEIGEITEVYNKQLTLFFVSTMYSVRAVTFPEPFNSSYPGCAGRSSIPHWFDDPNLDRSVYVGDERGVFLIRIRFQVSTQNFQGSTDPLPDGGRVLPYTAGKHKYIQATQGCGQGTDELPGLVTKGEMK